MKLLVLFSAWASDDADGRLWSNFYRDLLDEQFRLDDKIIVINCNAPSITGRLFSGITNTIALLDAPSHLLVSSDASGYQVALQSARVILSNYDVVLFAHAKGSSHSFSGNSTLRHELSRTIFDRNRIAVEFVDVKLKLVCHRGHLPQAPGSIHETSRVCSLLSEPVASFTMAATYTLYAVSAQRLMKVLDGAAPEFYSKNLNDLGYNRYFFEGPFPSVLAHGVEQVEFLVGCELEPSFNNAMCADAYPKHNSFLCRREFKKFCQDKGGYRQKATPYVFGPPAALTQLKIQYDP